MTKKKAQPTKKSAGPGAQKRKPVSAAVQEVVGSTAVPAAQLDAQAIADAGAQPQQRAKTATGAKPTNDKAASKKAAAEKAAAAKAAKEAAKEVAKAQAKPAKPKTVKPGKAKKVDAAKPSDDAPPVVQTSSAARAKKPKLVRDSFTIPKDEFAVLEALKVRAVAAGSPVKKGELLRAGIKALALMDDAAFQAALTAVPTLKTGRPSSQPAVEEAPTVNG